MNRYRQLVSCTFLGAVVLLVNYSAAAQGVGSAGAIRGSVRDPANRVVAGAEVTLVETARGIRRAAVTDASGEYSFAGLPPASYSLTALASGFAAETRTQAVVNVGSSTTVDFQLTLASAPQSVEIVAASPPIDGLRGSQANVLEERYIASLPIDRRDYLTFSLLAPGVSDANRLTEDTNFRVMQTPQSGLSFYGSNGRGNNITVDGGEANDDAGGVRPTVSQDAVQEFQVNRGNYDADLGAASGASINIVTKRGSNQVHGSVYGFFRNNALDARDHFAVSQALQPGDPFSLSATGHPVKDSLNRQQFGGAMGMPIRKDRTFLFAAFEGLHSNAQNAVPLFTSSGIFAPTDPQRQILNGLTTEGNAPVPCLGGLMSITILPASTCANALAAALTVNPTATSAGGLGAAQIAQDRFIVNQFEKDGGLFPFPIRQYQFSTRLDHSFGTKDLTFLRYNLSHNSESDLDLQALTAFSRGTSALVWDSTVQTSWFHLFSSRAQNEARVQWNLYQANVSTNDPGGPGLDVPGFGFFGRNIFLPSRAALRRYEFADNWTAIKGKHTLKAGASELLRGNNTTSDTFFAGRFEFLTLPGIFVSPCLQIPVSCGLPGSLAGASISSLQAWSLGLPAFYQQGFGHPQYSFVRPLTAAYVQDQWQIRPNLTLSMGLRYELDTQAGALLTNKHDFAPRLSFAWGPGRDHKTVVRGGYGIFFSPIYAQIDDVLQTLGNINGNRQIANTLVSILGLPSNPAINSAAIYQTLFAEGKILCGAPPPGDSTCITPSDLQAFGLNVSHSGALPPGTVLFSAQPGYRNPYAQQASLGIEHQIGNDAAVGASVVWVHTLRLPWAVDRNLLPGAPIVTGAGANGLPTNGLPFQDWGAPQCIVAPPAINPCFADPTGTILQDNVYTSQAAAVYRGLILEFRKRFSHRVTLMASYTYSKAEDDATDFNSDYSAFNETNLAAERAVSDFDQRHKVVVAGIIESPWHSRALSGFELSPIWNFHSGHPFNLLAGADINGDDHFTNDRPPGDPRNSGRGPDFAELDLRLSRHFNLTEKLSLQLLVESFNLGNRTNYASVNNVVGAAFGPPFNAQGNAALSPSQPLAFTSDFPKREIQAGVRLTF
jgi:Carboxypeptidase regulatory-like domain/TonB dependent receptor